MKKLLAYSLALVLALGALAGCNGGTSSATPAESVAPGAESTATPEEPSGELLQIGVLQLITHPALDASYEGFVDVLAEAGYVQDETVNIEYQNASGEVANCNTIASKFVNDGKDLVLAIATQPAQALANATDTIPIVVTAVTDPQDAGVVDSNEVPGRNVTGSSDLTPCAEHMALLVRLLPDAKTVGFLYDSSESNSSFQVEIARAAAVELGLETVDLTVSSSNDIQQVVQSAVGRVDVIYSPTDNTIANAMATVAMIATENNIPCIVGEEGMVSQGGLASLSISYYELGRTAGEMAVRILEGEDPATMPVEYQTKLSLVYNSDAFAALGIDLPADIVSEGEDLAGTAEE